MKIKQTVSAVMIVFVLSVAGTFMLPSSDASALTAQQCFDRFNNKDYAGQVKKRYDNSDCSSKKCIISKASPRPGDRDTIICDGKKDPDTSDPENPDPAGSGAECSTAVLPKSFCEGDAGEGIFDILTLIIRILAAGVGLVAVGGIIYAAILYASAENNAQQTKKAKDIIANVIIGIVSFALMWAFLEFIIPGGVFN